ncbi:hypothetical protein [Terracoccus luteus]|uniref:Uncharacterized protein n=1 Tax=Terracoccus luteus TaxID=53356 RepID=A0A839PUP7_9MICO|nr:hypothetical protein [Terracoccus luteus]MBB2986939.1 hypothetical protein [Terracoccus luteus]MCP2172590.1 hypothetical protein [Terracoccus luteus]
MSRTPLWSRLVDDAAVFPPGLAPLPRAVADHLDRRPTAHGPFVGPLLVPATAAAEVAALAAADPRTATEPLEVALVVRPGATDPADTLDPLAPLRAAVDVLRDDEHVVVTGVELGADPGWQAALDLEVPVALEVGRGEARRAALDEVAAAVDDEADVTVKFRTGATPTWPWPDESTVGRVLDDVVLRGLSLKLTGGLHHVVRADHDGEPQHGLLNVVVAVHEALGGAEADELAGILRERSTELLAGAAARIDDPAAERLRETFVSYGCCGVTDPLGELEALGLLPTGGARP